MYLEELIFLVVVVVLIVLYRNYKGQNVSKFITDQVQDVYNRFAPYSFKVVREKTKELGQEYTPRQYMIQILVMASFTGVVSYLVVNVFIVNLFLNKFKFILRIRLWNLQRLSLLLKH